MQVKTTRGIYMKKIISIFVVALFAGSMVAANSMASETKVADAKTAGSETKSAGSEAKSADSEAKTAETKPAGSETKPAVVAAATDATLEVIEIAVAKGIENREAIDVADTFTPDVERLYCYTKIKGGKEGDSITHRWKKGEDVMAEVSLNVNGSPWRTHSSKAIMKEWLGTWTVEILQGDAVLKSKEFTIK
jgi:Protein of unknown function (DUF2914)